MKHTKQFAALTALITALAPVSLGMQAIAPASVSAESDALALPEWVPSDYASAQEFRSTYGVTHIGDGLLCAVHESGNPQLSPHFLVNGSTPERDAGCVFDKSFERYPDAEDSPYYEVLLYQPAKSGELTVTWNYDHAQTDYTFEIDADKSITETDIFGWLPDSAAEYRTYSLSHFPVSVRDNYVVFCLSSGSGTGTGWVETSGGSMCFAPAVVSDCTDPASAELEGGELQRVYAYKAIKDGYAVIRYDTFDSVMTDGGTGESYTADCAVLENAQTVLLAGQMRVTLEDIETGGLIPLSEAQSASMWTNAEVSSPEGTASTGPICVLTENPSVQDGICAFFGADSFSFGMDEAQLPAGYTYPEDVNDHEYGYFNGTVMPEHAVTVTRYDNGAADVVFRLQAAEEPPTSDLLPGQMRVTVEDIETGEAIPVDAEHPLSLWTTIRYKTEEGTVSSGPFEYLRTNPATFDELGRHFDANTFEFGLNNANLPEGYSLPGTRAELYGYFTGKITPSNYVRVTRYENGSADVVFRLYHTGTGDINGDGAFGVADAVTLHRYLLGNYMWIANWKAADYNSDGKLNAADLTLMKRALMRKQLHVIAEPTTKLAYSNLLYVVEDGLKMYTAPDERYPAIAALPDGTHLFECGYMEGNEDWIYTEYEGQHGWIRIRYEDGTRTVFYDAVADKPVIYLYPEQETDVHVALDLNGMELATTYPKYSGGWDVTAYPDGTLLNKADGSHHRYLFWDAKNVSTRFDFSEGFCVAGSDTEQFLKETLTAIGLTESEMNEFIVYWLPRMESNAYNLISFQSTAYTDAAKLEITPAPDSLLRVFMAYVPLDEAVEIAPQTFETFARTGFAAVEWGGTELRQN